MDPYAPATVWCTLRATGTHTGAGLGAGRCVIDFLLVIFVVLTGSRSRRIGGRNVRVCGWVVRSALVCHYPSIHPPITDTSKPPQNQNKRLAIPPATGRRYESPPEEVSLTFTEQSKQVIRCVRWAVDES